MKMSNKMSFLLSSAVMAGCAFEGQEIGQDVDTTSQELVPVSGAFRLENLQTDLWLQRTDEVDETTADSCGGDDATNVRLDGQGNTGPWTEWEFVDAGGDYFYIASRHDGKVVQGTNQPDATDSSFNAVRMVPQSCGGHWTQWRAIDAGGGTFRLENRQFGMWLQGSSVADAQSGGGTQVRLVPSSFSGNRTKWRSESIDAPPGPEPDVPWRVGVSADGNQHDADDWHASPMMLALLHEAGFEDRLVHFDYNNHLGSNSASMAQTHEDNINRIRNALGYDSSIFFDDQDNSSGAVQSIAQAINASSADDRFFLLCAGPMEVCWRGIDAAQDDKERFVTVVSHSSWNDNHSDTGQMNHQWSDIRSDFDVLAHHINDQNPPAFKSDCSEWQWLNQVSGYGNALFDVVCTGDKRGDASDAGMMWYLIQNNGEISGSNGSSSPTMSQVRNFFGVGSSGGNDGGGNDGGAGQAGECTTTNQCKQSYGSSATDCRNDLGGICYCGSSTCG